MIQAIGGSAAFDGTGRRAYGAGPMRTVRVAILAGVFVLVASCASTPGRTASAAPSTSPTAEAVTGQSVMQPGLRSAGSATSSPTGSRSSGTSTSAGAAAS